MEGPNMHAFVRLFSARVKFKLMLLLGHSHTHLKVQPFQIENSNKTIRFVDVNPYGKVRTLWSRRTSATKDYKRGKMLRLRRKIETSMIQLRLCKYSLSHLFRALFLVGFGSGPFHTSSCFIYVSRLEITDILRHNKE